MYVGELLFLESIVMFFGVLNIRGADIGGKVQVALALLLAFGVTALTLGTFLAPTAQITNLQPLFAAHQPAIASIASLVAIAPWLYVGFDTIPQAAEEFNFSPEKAGS